ncbi:phosphate ABC transporter substrate-binding protein PstS family protein [Clostridium sp. 'deep sea']|uniref:phosphate ABC transporter substrate-binding protein n=1 Tax=Clostridium sp. 'deep sea' TaxID=2779445 RepID=UPI0018965974|nr:phosphate ABC transporter substrate-binding protein [Clostridium sp. 'deep sea']QOR35751.1 phosphate ABC transporter substrate-binding protein PstS family protein [Clostridium sp. 'deep sea']
MKRIFNLVLIIVSILVIFAGCTNNAATPANENPPNNNELSGTLTTAGSTSVQPFSDLLKEAFEKHHANVTVNVQGGGSSAGGTAAISGAAGIGALSRELKSKELNSGLKPIVIAKDGIAIVTHESNSVNDLTIAQIASIFTGEVKSWKDLGGADKPINAINREASSGTRGAFKDIVLGKENDFESTLVTQGSTGAVKAAVKADPNAIGYISLASIDSTVKAVKVNGIEATIENIVSGSYPVSRPFNYATNGTPKGLAKEFIDFALSQEGQFLAETLGLIPVNKVTGTLTIAGSTSVQPLSDLLKEKFEKIHPNITVNVQGGGSSAGGTAALSGAADIGALSREMKGKELEDGLVPVVIAKDGIAIVVHKNNSIKQLTIEQISGIFTGEIKNWNELGGADKPINAINREASSGTRGAFKDIVLGKENDFDSSLVTQGSTGAVKAAVQNDENAIGYISLGSLDKNVKAVIVENAEATVANILKETYPVARPFNYATKGNAKGLAKWFIEFTLSDKGQELCEKAKVIAVK